MSRGSTPAPVPAPQSQSQGNSSSQDSTTTQIIHQLPPKSGFDWQPIVGGAATSLIAFGGALLIARYTNREANIKAEADRTSASANLQKTLDSARENLQTSLDAARTAAVDDRDAAREEAIRQESNSRRIDAIEKVMGNVASMVDDLNEYHDRIRKDGYLKANRLDLMQRAALTLGLVNLYFLDRVEKEWDAFYSAYDLARRAAEGYASDMHLKATENIETNDSTAALMNQYAANQKLAKDAQAVLLTRLAEIAKELIP